MYSKNAPGYGSGWAFFMVVASTLRHAPSDIQVGTHFGVSRGAQLDHEVRFGERPQTMGTLTDAVGVFFKRSRIGLRDITDGSTQTVAMSERLNGPGPQDSGNLEPDVQRLMLEIPKKIPAPTSVPVLAVTCRC